jgi:hypothetical protein
VLFAGTLEGGFERFRTEWEGDLFAVASDDTDGAWILGQGSTRDAVTLLHWDGKTLHEVGSPGPWRALGTGPDGALRVAGGTQGAVIADAGLAIEWSIDGIAPVADIAVTDDGVAYSAADGYRNGVVGVYDGEWRAVDVGDIQAITQVESLSDGEALFVTDDGNAWRWDGATATEEDLPVPGIGHYVTAFAAGPELALAAGSWYDQGENRDAMLEVRDATGIWSDADLAALPGEWIFALAIDEAGTDGRAATTGATDTSRRGRPSRGPRSSSRGSRAVRSDSGPGPAAVSGCSSKATRTTKGSMRSTAPRSRSSSRRRARRGPRRRRAPDPRNLAAVTFDEGSTDPGPAIVVRGKDGTWSPVALVDEEVQSLAVLPDASILAGTWQGALRLSDCAWH